MFSKRLLLLAVLLLSACGSGNPATGSPQNIAIQYSPAAAFFIPELLACAGSNEVSAVMQPTDFLDPQAADMLIRMGETQGLSSPAYQIGSEKIVVVINQGNPINTLSETEIRSLFMGRIQNWSEAGGDDNPVQVWVLPASEDIQSLFNAEILQGSPMTSAARIATSMDEMVKAVSGDVNAIGILSENRVGGDMNTVFETDPIPILAILPAMPDARLSVIITCMQ
jgi:hypothetical protein